MCTLVSVEEVEDEERVEVFAYAKCTLIDELIQAIYPRDCDVKLITFEQRNTKG